jgi:hypothetical protein
MGSKRVVNTTSLSPVVESVDPSYDNGGSLSWSKYFRLLWNRYYLWLPHSLEARNYLELPLPLAFSELHRVYSLRLVRLQKGNRWFLHPNGALLVKSYLL